MKQKWFAAWQLPMCPAWPWRALETTHCFPKQCLQILFSQKPEEMAPRMHPPYTRCWVGELHWALQGSACCSLHCWLWRGSSSPVPLSWLPAGIVCLRTHSVPEHPKSSFNALMPFRQTKNLLPGLHPLQALLWHSFLLDHY